MRSAHHHALFLALMLSTSPAVAQTVSDEGANDLAKTFAGYVGQKAIDDKFVSIAVDGDAYSVTIDIPKMIADAKPDAEKVDVTAEPFVFHTQPQADGTWKVTADDFPSFKVVQKKEGGDETVDIQAEGYAFEGTYDPKIAAFATGTAKLDKVSFTSTGPQGDAHGEQGPTKLTITGTDAGGGTDVVLSQTSESLTETIQVKGESPMNVSLRTGAITVDAKIEGAKSTSILDLVSFMVAHPGKDNMKAAEGDLKAHLTATLPLWKGMTATVGVKDLSVDTPIGPVKFGSFSESIGLSGLNKEGYYDIALKLGGLAIPDGVAPPWSKPLVPSDADISARVSGIDMDAVARLAIDKLDVGGADPWPKDVQDQLSAYFTNGPLRVTLKPGSITAPSLTVGMEGDAAVLPQPPEGRAIITADGLDKAMAALQSAGDADPTKQQALMMMGFAKAMSKPADGGKASWTVEYQKDGSVTVNGQAIPH